VSKETIQKPSKDVKGHIKYKKKCRTLNHPDISACLNNIGIVLNNQGNNDEALDYLQRALIMWEKYLPANHPDIADGLDNIGLTIKKLNQSAKTYQAKIQDGLRLKTLFSNSLPDNRDYLLAFWRWDKIYIRLFFQFENGWLSSLFNTRFAAFFVRINCDVKSILLRNE
jgi:tetratricopeptide (TPR) repeat protein